MSANDKLAATFHSPDTAANLTDALEQFDLAFGLHAPSIDLAARLADLNTAARAHIDWLDQGERG